MNYATKTNHATITSPNWIHEELDHGQRPSAEQIEDVLLGLHPGIVLRNVITPAACDLIVEKLALKQGAHYDAIELDWALDIRVPAHWEIRYGHGTWQENIAGAVALDNAIVDLFGENGHPRDLMARALSGWRRGPVESLSHPIFGKPVAAGQVRRGAPKAHVDDANYDIPGLRSYGQIGVNIMLANPEHGDLVVYNRVWNRPGNSEGIEGAPVGNYDLPRDAFEGAASTMLPCNVGDMVIVSNRFIHEVTPVAHPRDRVTFALHAAWLLDGSLALFS